VATRDPGRQETGGARAQRADARTNRIRILEAADEVFGKGGESASTEEVARLAAVGIATVFRHFPTKTALLEAVLARRFQRLHEEAEASIASADPATAFFDFFRHLVLDAPAKIAITEALLDAGGGENEDDEVTRASQRLRASVGTLLQRAQRVGSVRSDTALPEVYALLVGASRAAAHVRLDTQARDRMLAIVFDGLTVQRSGTARR